MECVNDGFGVSPFCLMMIMIMSITVVLFVGGQAKKRKEKKRDNGLGTKGHDALQPFGKQCK